MEEEFLEPSVVKWFEKTEPNFEMNDLPRPNIHSGEIRSLNRGGPLIIAIFFLTGTKYDYDDDHNGKQILMQSS